MRTCWWRMPIGSGTPWPCGKHSGSSPQAAQGRPSPPVAARARRRAPSLRRSVARGHVEHGVLRCRVQERPGCPFQQAPGRAALKKIEVFSQGRGLSCVPFPPRVPFPQRAYFIRHSRAGPAELVCPAGTPPALAAAVDNGADDVYLGFTTTPTRATSPGSTSTTKASPKASTTRTRAAAGAGGAQHLPAAGDLDALDGRGGQRRRARRRRDHRGRPGLDGLRAQAASRSCACTFRCRARPPATRRSTSTTSTSASSAPCCRACSRSSRSSRWCGNTPVEIEVFGFGSLCVMVEGRCALSSYATGESPNLAGVCSPAKAVRWEQHADGLESRLGGMLIDRFGAGEHAALSDRSARAASRWTTTPTTRSRSRRASTRWSSCRARGDGRRGDQDRGAPAQPRVRGDRDARLARGPRRSARAPQRLRRIPSAACAAPGRRRTQHTLGAYHRPWK